MLTKKEQSLLESLESRAIAEGIEIITVEVVGSQKAPTIRIYLDAPGGISFDQLASAQVWINEIMDDIDPFPGAYTLEVSSPGIDRPLRTAEHFAQQIGEKVVISCTTPRDGRSKWTGILVASNEEGVCIDVEGTEQSFTLSEIKRAHVVGTIDFNAKG